MLFFTPFTPAAEQKHNECRHGFLAKFGAVIEPNLIYITIKNVVAPV